MKRGAFLLLIVMVFSCATSALASDATLSTLWPLFDYRASESADYKSLHLLGPLLKYETKGFETEYTLRPLFYRSVDNKGVSETEVLYPVFAYSRDKESFDFHLIHLLNYDYGAAETGSRNRSYLFPFLFMGEEDQGRYAAFFPFGGTLYNWFGRDRISFALFPLYGHTERQDTQVDNILWPFFSRTTGEKESGFKIWPIYGESHKEGVYRKKFFLWPFFVSKASGLNSENPTETTAFWPFYITEETSKSSSKTVLWPFFSWTENRVKEYEVWDAPWPLVRVTRGERYHGIKLLPFYADETMDVMRQRWYLWPLYKVEEMNSELIERRRDRFFFFLYSDLTETKLETGDSYRRVDLWPLFSFKRTNGVSHLHALSLVPFFSGNQSIERLWSPLWRLYQQKWDRQGNHVVSVLWNLYWHEKQGERLAWEFFPLMNYRRESAHDLDVSFLKGLVSYSNDDDGKQLHLFYLPWGFRWSSENPGQM